MRNKQGFTLIELLIVLSILGVLASIAYPSYQKIVIETRRSDAQSELIKAQIEQSSYRIINPTYLSDTTSLGLPSVHAYYKFTVVASMSTYTLKAEAKVNTSQDNDESMCKTLYIDQDNNKTSDGSTDNASCWIN